MSKLENKRKKILERIKLIEADMILQLTKKDSSTPELSIAQYRRRIMEAKAQLKALT